MEACRKRSAARFETIISNRALYMVVDFILLLAANFQHFDNSGDFQVIFSDV